MARIKQSPKMPAEQRREQLLEAARKLFIEKGYRDTSTEEIAQKAGLTKGALYFHFESKEEILLALVRLMSGQFQMALESLPTPLTPWQVVEAVTCCTDTAKPREFRSVIDIWVQALKVPRIRKYIRDEHEKRVGYMLDHMDPGFRLSRHDLEQMVILTFAICDGLAARRVFNNESVDLEAQMRLIRAAFHGFIKGNRQEIHV